MLACVVCKLENVDFENTKLTPQQVTVLCQVVKENSLLNSLNLEHDNLSGVEPELLASAVSKIENVELWYTSLTKQQIIACQRVNRSQGVLAMGPWH